MSRRHNLNTIRRAAAPAPAAAGHRPLLLAVALAAGFPGLPARAQPTGAQAVVGAASLSQQGSKLVVTTQNGPGANFSSINWQSFSVPAGTTTHFAQPGVTSTSINRVLGPDPSAIFGTLSSNGRLVLVNPAGITVGAGAVVDTAAFTASTLRMSDADALAGRLRFADGSGAALRVDGQVLARQGDVVLIGQNVQAGAQALVQSPQGATILAAGQKVEVTGRGLEGIFFEVQAPADQAVNLGTLQGDAVGVFAGTLKHSGVVQAQAVSTEGGKVVLRAADMAQVAGTVQARGLAGAGGSVDVLGSKVGVLAGARLDTSNTAGGGRIRIGGDYQGADAAVPNAQVAYVDPDAQLRANATAAGNGGRVIVWADDTTRAYGSIEAKAGPQGGDGGFVETSGKRSLDVNGIRVNASAAKGQAGTWLLDPDDLQIVAGSGTGLYNLLSDIFTPAAAVSTVYESELNAALNAGSATNVTIRTTASSSSLGVGSGDITLVGSVNITRTSAGSGALTLEAYHDIRFTGGTTSFGASDPLPSPAPVARTLDVTLRAGTGGSGHIITEAGAGVQTSAADGASTVNLTADLSATANKQWENDGTLLLNANGTVDVSAGELLNNGYVGGSMGTLKVGSFTQPAPAPTSPAPTLAPTGGMSLEVTRSFSVAGGEFMFNGKDLAITQQSGALAIPAGSFADIYASGTVKLQANAGDIVVDKAVTARAIDIRALNGAVAFTDLDASGGMGSAGGAVAVTGSAGVAGSTIYSFGGDGSFAGGGNGGTINVVSSGGAVSVGSAAAAGGSGSLGAGGAGGSVTLSGVSVEAGYVDVSGGSGAGGAAGGNAGSVRLAAGAGGLSGLGGVFASGGYGGDSATAAGGAGGAGGTVDLSAGGGTIDLSGASIDAWGGDGGAGATLGGAGGAGGRITVTASAGGVLTSGHSGFSESPTTYLDATGGWGGDTSGTAGTDRGGAGGIGGKVLVNASGDSQLLGLMYAEGGRGGWANAAGGSARGGSGGGGGALALNVQGSSQLGGDAMAGGGQGGGAYDTSFGEDTARFGATGAAGGVATSGGTYSIPLGYALPTTGTLASPYDSSLNVGGIWTNSATVVLQPSSWVLASESVVNSGTVDIGGGAVLSLGMHDSDGETFTPGGGTFTNAPGAVLQGRGTLEASVFNAGTIKVGDTATDAAFPIGTFSIAGNLVQQPTGTIAFDVAANAPFQPGGTYDQLQVSGTAVLDGTLQVQALPAVSVPAPTPVPTPAPTQPPLLAAALTAPATTDTYVLLDVAGGASGSFGAYSGPGDLLPLLQMNSGGSLQAIPGAVLPPPAPPAPPPSPVVLASGPLVDKIVGLLNGSATSDQVQAALAEQDNLVTRFLDKLVDEDEKQKDAAKGEVVYTDTACKPS